MNNPSPLIPQGAIPPRAKSSLYFKVMMVVGVHVVVIGGMLLQGCKDTSTKDQANQNSSTPPDAASVSATTPNTAPAQADVPSTVNPGISNVVAGAAVSAAPPMQAPPSANLVPPAIATDLTATPGEAKDYAIAKGDTLGAIAHKNLISLKALTEANPNVDAKKLQIGQKIRIPAGSTAVVSATAKGAAPGAAAADVATDATQYTVKTGDMLARIAKAHGTTVKQIMAMNDLKTTTIRVGQKLKIPAKPAGPDHPAATPASASAAPAAMPATTPVAAN